MDKKLKFGVVGLGARGSGLLKYAYACGKGGNRSGMRYVRG